VARYSVTQPVALINAIQKAIRHQGFSFIEALSPCPTQYGRRKPARSRGRDDSRSDGEVHPGRGSGRIERSGAGREKSLQESFTHITRNRVCLA